MAYPELVSTSVTVVNSPANLVASSRQPASWTELNLAASKLSGKLCQTRDFQLKASSFHHLCILDSRPWETVQGSVGQVVWPLSSTTNWFTSSFCLIQVVEFLTDCYHEGKGYSTINTYRSALSTTLCFMNDDRDSLGLHPLIARLLKGVYILILTNG